MDEEKDKQPNSMAITFGDIPKVPTQDAIDGIKFDFNDGLRVLMPKGAKPYHVRFVDLGTKSCVYDAITPEGGGVLFSASRSILSNSAW